jgi:phosphopantothenoylcysteine decarboxylase/phosphopantothenate--cysteine ligase
MNDRMWAHPQTQQNVAHLRSLGYEVLDPDAGPLAAATEGAGPGRMPEPETLVAHVGRLLETRARGGARSGLAGRRVVVTAGPTREPMDPVRYISNRSSGKMGVAIAAAAWRRGADVTLIAGPLGIAAPPGVTVRGVESTEEMCVAVGDAIAAADALVMAAAPADFRPATPADRKIKKSAAPDAVALAPTPDILVSTRDKRRPGMVVVGFALETNDAVSGGKAKLVGKDLDLVVVNDATEAGAGFGVDTNRVTLLARSGDSEELPLMSKGDVAEAILDRVERLLTARGAGDGR